MEPTKKAKTISQQIEQVFGFNREDNIRAGGCAFDKSGMAYPDCHGDRAVKMLGDDPLVRKEYKISGICAACQKGFSG